MKKMKLFPVVLIAIAFFTASCVDNTLSPQVEAIRGQQVEWMKAKTATELALAAFQTAEAAFQTAETDELVKRTAFDEATRSWSLKLQESTYNYNKAIIDANIAQKQVDLANAQTELKNALSSLAFATTNSGSAEAQKIYAKYSEQINILTSASEYGWGLYDERGNLQTELDNAKLLVSTNVNVWPSVAKDIQSQIDVLKAQLATQTATRASLYAAKASSSASASFAQSLASANQSITYKLDSLNSVLGNANSLASYANTKVTTLQLTISTYNNYATQLKDPNISAPNKLTAESETDATHTVAYNDAVSKYPQAVQSAVDASALVSKITNQYSALQKTRSDNSSIIGNLTFNIDYLISLWNSNVNYTQQNIDSKTATLNSNNNSQTYANAEVSRLTSLLAIVNVKITDVEKAAAYWKSLLDKTFTV